MLPRLLSHCPSLAGLLPFWAEFPEFGERSPCLQSLGHNRTCSERLEDVPHLPSGHTLVMRPRGPRFPPPQAQVSLWLCSLYAHIPVCRRHSLVNPRTSRPAADPECAHAHPHPAGPVAPLPPRALALALVCRPKSLTLTQSHYHVHSIQKSPRRFQSTSEICLLCPVLGLHLVHPIISSQAASSARVRRVAQAHVAPPPSGLPSVATRGRP